jgi:hypothetical protein
MLSIQYIFNDESNSELLFTETLIDLMFDYIDDSNILLDDILDKELIIFKNKVNNLFKIKIIYEQTNDNTLNTIFIKPNIIKILIPINNLNNITGKDILRVFLHELSHYFTHSRVPEYLIINKNKNTIQNRIKNRLLFPPSTNVSWNEKDLNLVRKFLDYIFQINELPNFALSFSLGFIDTKDNIDLFFSDNLFMINKYLKDNNSNSREFFKWYDNILDNDLRLLFQIQYFVKYLNESKYQRQLIKLKKLIKKYYKRLLIYF